MCLLVVCLVAGFAMGSDQVDIDQVGSAETILESTPASAFLVGTRKFTPTLIVQNTDVLVEYFVVNAGSLAAVDVLIQDVSFGDEAFDIVQGSLPYSADSLAPGAEISFNITVKAKKAGEYGDSSTSSAFKSGVSMVTYVSEEDLEAKRTHFLGSKEPLVVEDEETYRKRTDLHLIDWAVYLFLASFLTLVPFGVSMGAYRDLEKLQSKKAKKTQ